MSPYPRSCIRGTNSKLPGEYLSHVNNLPKSSAIDQLFNLVEASQIASQELGASLHPVSFPVTGFATEGQAENRENAQEQRNLAETGAACPKKELVRRVGIEPTT